MRAIARPVLGALEPRPAPLGRAARVDEVAAPHRDRRGRLVGRDRELLVAARLELHEDAAEQPGRLLAASASISSVARLTIAFTNAPPDGLQSIARRISSRALRPAADLEQHARDVPAEQVAVDRAEVRLARRGDAAVRLVDGLRRAARAAPARWVRLALARIASSIRPCADARSSASRRSVDGRLGRVPLAARDRERRERRGSPRARPPADRARHVDRLAGDPLRVPERGGEHPLLREQREDPGPLHRRVRRDDVGSLAERRGRALGIARREQVAAQACLDDGVLEAVLPLPERPRARSRRRPPRARVAPRPRPPRRRAARSLRARPGPRRPPGSGPRSRCRRPPGRRPRSDQPVARARSRSTSARRAAPRARARSGPPRMRPRVPRRAGGRSASGAPRRPGRRRRRGRAPRGSGAAASAGGP